MKNHAKIFWFMTFHTKLWLVKNHYILIRFSKTDGFIRVDGTRYLVLFGPENYNSIYNRNKVRYFIGQKVVLRMFFSYNYAKIKMDSYVSWSFRKRNWLYMIELTFLYELMLIRQANQKSLLLFTIGIFKIKDFSFNQMSAIGVMMY